MKEYHKIETIFNRDMEGTKRLILDSFRSPYVEYLKDNTWIFTEKVDGTNVRVHWDGHAVSFGGRTDKANIPKHLLAKLNGLFASSESEQIFEQLFGEKKVILFGEGYGQKIQKGGNYLDDVGFILFDVQVSDTFLVRSSVEEIAAAFGIRAVPVVLVGTIHDAIEFNKTRPASAIAVREMFMEGVVGMPDAPMLDRMGRRIIVKIKWDEFKHLVSA